MVRREIMGTIGCHHVHLLFVAAVLSMSASFAHGQGYPAKPIRVVIPFATGGATDTPGRALVEQLAKVPGYHAFVDNRPGAGSTIGAAVVASAPPDGYTLLLTATTHIIAAHLYKTLRYHAVDDFAPVMQIGVAPSVLVVHPSLPARSVKELVTLAFARPGEIDFASSGVGTAQHMFSEMFQMLSATSMRHIPYQGGRPEIDVISGRVQVWFPGMARAIPQIQAGRLRALGTTGAQRSAGLPDVPTIAEAGVRGYEADLWAGVLAPKGTPAEIVARLHAEMARALKLPEVEKRFIGSGNEIVATDPQRFGRLLRSDFERWGKVARNSGITLN
jgi:tripartite-type tricarboxylate transporter receptor subunit TctC